MGNPDEIKNHKAQGVSSTEIKKTHCGLEATVSPEGASLASVLQLLDSHPDTLSNFEDSGEESTIVTSQKGPGLFPEVWNSAKD